MMLKNEMSRYTVNVTFFSEKKMEYDEYGFAKTWDKEYEDIYVRYQEKEKKIDLEWSNYLEKIGSVESLKLNDKKLKEMVRNGIPFKLRAVIWSKITGAFARMVENPSLFTEFNSLKEAIPQKVINIIETDIPRTFSNAKSNLGEQIRKILQAFALMHPEVGYCQALNFLAAILTSVCGDELGFWNLICIYEDYIPSAYYTNGLVDFQTDLRLMIMLIAERCPELSDKAQNLHYDWISLCSDWLLCNFVNCFPMPTVLRIWDAYLLEGQKIIFRVGIAFLRLHQEALLAANNLKEFNNVLEEAKKNCLDQDLLMETAFKLKYFSRKRLLELKEIAKDPKNPIVPSNYKHKLLAKI